MNTAQAFLKANWQRLELQQYGIAEHPACVILTPRFRASRHIVFLVLARESTRPALVVKVPRLAGPSSSIEREATVLRAIQTGRKTSLETVPRVVALETFCNRPLLIETALIGRPMDRSVVRHDRAGCCQATLDWLITLQSPRTRAGHDDPDWFSRLIERPLHAFAAVFPLDSTETRLWQEALDWARLLRTASLPLVVEHGDLSHPNVMLLDHGLAGVVDWELADVHGLPACDLFFFLTYAAFATHRIRSTPDYVAAFHNAFFQPAAWASGYVRNYAAAIGLDMALIKPLFVVCWTRYLAHLLLRLINNDDQAGGISAETVTWLRSNRYYSLWRHALTNVQALDQLNAW